MDKEKKSTSFQTLRQQIGACRRCQDDFGFEPRPILFGNPQAKIMQISQAPSRAVHNTGRPFNDASGQRLRREWYQISDEDFYNPDNFYITSTAHCYPGKNPKGGDKRPPKCCAPLWLSQEVELVQNRLYILIGGAAASCFFPKQRLTDLVFQDLTINGKPAFVLPHPSPLNVKWLRDYPQFQSRRILEVAEAVHQVLGLSKEQSRQDSKSSNNPWETIGLSDYENHMQLDSVMQLQTLNQIMKKQLSGHDSEDVMILGVAGGNGLNHAAPDRSGRLYGVDINSDYLKACIQRYPALHKVFIPVQADLCQADPQLPQADLVIANLFIEYVGYENFCRALQRIQPHRLSCVIQINKGSGFVSDSPYLHAFDRLDEVHHNIERDGLVNALKEIGYRCILEEESELPNGKALLQLDFTDR